jgi:HD domain
MHPEDLGTHTRRVATNLLALPEFQALGTTDKLLTELAAYFHDMGKGPKSRWGANQGNWALSSRAMQPQIEDGKSLPW